MLLVPTTKRSSSSVDTVTGDDDLITQILLHLPITSLLRFKSVSKHWLSLITNPVTLPQPHYLSLINPQCTYATAVNLAFDPSKSPHYKVILVFTLPGIYYVMEIHSSETGLWKHTNESIRLQVNFCLGVFWNGAINWSSRWGDSLYFNIQEEQIGTIPMPPIPKDFRERRLMYFGVSNNHLHIVKIYGPQTTIFNVYEMERDYSGWFVKYRVDLDVLMNAFPESISRHLDPSDLHYYQFVILGLVRGEDDEDSFVVLHIPGKAIGYRFKDRTFRKLCDFPPGETYIECGDNESSTDIECAGNESSLKFNGCIQPGLSLGTFTLTALFLGAHDQLPRGSPILGLLWSTTRLTSEFLWDPKPGIVQLVQHDPLVVVISLQVALSNVELVLRPSEFLLKS
ncbi:hypothetical protein LguiA_029898 [Lonicera macranthoides]